MAWTIARDYAAFNPAAEALMHRAGWPYVLLRPPAVSRPLLLLADQTRAPGLDEEFRAWAATPAASVIDAEELRGRVPGTVEAADRLPRREDLLRCKWFSVAAQTPVAAYAAEMFGGAVEYEWCWLFGAAAGAGGGAGAGAGGGTGAGPERVLVMAWAEREVRVVRRTWLFRRRTVTRRVCGHVTAEVTAEGVAERPHPGVPVLFDDAARHLGIELRRGAFLPHTRGFDAGPYHVLPRRKRDHGSAGG